MNLQTETEFLLKKYNLRANKKLGQNFLISDDIVNQIILEAEVSKEDTIIEIGPGLGALTAKLAENAKEVIAIELDDNMINVLTERFSLYENVKIIHGDVLKVNLNELIADKPSVKVVANLPYYITTPIVMKLLEEKLNIEQITVMVQKEVGERLSAKPKTSEYGAITAILNYYFDITYEFTVDRKEFYPIPNVDSCIIKLSKNTNHVLY